MSIIANAVGDMLFTYDRELLNITFFKIPARLGMRGRRGLTLESQITDLVVIPRVVKDCNLIGGEIVKLSLTSLKYRFTSEGVVIHVPNKLIDNRQIIAVHNMNVLRTEAEFDISDRVFTRSGSLLSGADNSLNRPLMSEGTSHTSTRLIGNNTILIRNVDEDSFYRNGNIEFLLTNAVNLNNILRPYYTKFSQLVEYAVGAYIYKELNLSIERYTYSDGNEYTTLRNAVDELKEMNNEYKDMRDTTWPKISVLNDDTKMDRLIKMRFLNI